MISLVWAPQPRKHIRNGAWLRLGWLLLVGYLLFAHGCHGDEDTELFARVPFKAEALP